MTSETSAPVPLTFPPPPGAVCCRLVSLSDHAVNYNRPPQEPFWNAVVWIWGPDQRVIGIARDPDLYMAAQLALRDAMERWSRAVVSRGVGVAMLDD